MSIATQTLLHPLNAPDSSSARRHGVGFWVVAAAFLTAMAFSTVPSPLYPLYQERDGFSTFMVTVVFAVYAVGVIVSLILAGHVSDWVGRKKVLITALLLELVAAIMFLSGTALPVLLVARFITGLGVGVLTATATAYLHELHTKHRPEASGQRFEKVSTAANIGGLGVGPLVAGILAQWVSAPLHTPYAVFAVLLVVAVIGVALVPETVAELPVRPAYRPQRIDADHGDRAGYFATAAAGFASFSVFGVFTSVAPGFVAGTLDHPSRLLSGATVFAVFGTAALAQTLTSRMTSTAKLALGISAEAVGLITLVTGMHALSLPMFLIGGVIAGIGAGVLFKAAVGAVTAMAAPAQRSEALAGLFLISYLGLGIPALGIGVATLEMSATTAMTGLAAIVLVLLTGVAMLARRATVAR
ncbi:MFS transporter [Rhodococcus sp. 077-4]|uniref:MFS transporter n=1 Tax=Rhodococcus sp. 077-4 TaxID=2789271 RepID=UPI0039F4A9B8